MFDQMIESRNSGSERSRMARFFLPVTMVVFAALSCGLTYSLFAYTLIIGDDNFDFSSLAPPVEIAPTVRQPETERSSRASQATSSNQSPRLSRRTFSSVSAPTNNPPKDSIGSKIPNVGFQTNNPNALGDAVASTGGCRDCRGGMSPTENSELRGPTAENHATEIPPPVKPPKPKVNPKPRAPISKGVINGEAKSLITPRYPVNAKAVGLTGQVEVQVTIDEKGNVISAQVIRGHAMFRDSVLAAARSTKFTPTYLSHEPVKVTGVIVYNFKG